MCVCVNEHNRESASSRVPLLVVIVGLSVYIYSSLSAASVSALITVDQCPDECKCVRLHQYRVSERHILHLSVTHTILLGKDVIHPIFVLFFHTKAAQN